MTTEQVRNMSTPAERTGDAAESFADLDDTPQYDVVGKTA
jgi:hypothetical protein